ncbi:transmembrane protein 59-like isoform X4 [Lepidochelys kempii]|uniref:transmembrane protein 59-like isoform X4 n=1 Tax=Lepidochelys kempii TaxID=8472 RepID=UPI003C6F75CC
MRGSGIPSLEKCSTSMARSSRADSSRDALKHNKPCKEPSIRGMAKLAGEKRPRHLSSSSLKHFHSLELQPVSFSMFDLVSSFCNDIVSSAQSFISSTWTFYLQADDGKVVVFQSQPEIEYPVPEMPAPKSELMEKSWPVSSPNTLRPHTGRKEKLEKPPMKEPKSKTKFQHVETHQPEHDFLGCMSKRGVVGCYRRSGLPRWILAACLFLSIMVMLWLSCASLVTAPDQHVKTQTLSINGDKEDLENLDGSAPFSLHPVIAVTICPADDNEEAGPLPVKVDLDKTVL